EVDFILLVQDYFGKIQIAVGECKSSGLANEITMKDVTHLRSVADSFPPERVDSFVVFSKTGVFTPDEIERCRQRQGERMRVILLAQRELEPYFVYEDTAKEFQLEQTTAISLDALARVTHNVFFEPKKK